MTTTSPPTPTETHRRIFEDKRRVHTPTVLQMEAVECGAATLGMILSYYGRHVPLEELRLMCGVSRDGSKASSILKAARLYGLEAHGYKRDLVGLETLSLPFVVFWNFNHYVVVEGFGKGNVYINDPASGPRIISFDEFDQSFTGVVLSFAPGPDFQKGGKRSTFWQSLITRLSGLGTALLFVFLVSVALVIPGLVIPTFTQIFVDSYLIGGNLSWIWALLVAMGATALVSAALTSLQVHFLLRLETKLALSMASKFIWHVLRLPLEFFNQRHSGEIAGRVAINDRVARLLSGQLALAALNVLTIVFYAFMMFRYDVLLTTLGVAIVALNFLALRIVSRRRVDSNQQVLQEQGKLYGSAASGLRAIETLKAVAAEGDLFARLTGYHAKAARAEQRLALYTYLLSVIPPALIAVNTAVILAIGSIRVINGSLTMGMLVAFQGLMTAFTTPVATLINLGGLVQQTEGDMKRLDDVLSYTTDPLVTNVLDEPLPAEPEIQVTATASPPPQQLPPPEQPAALAKSPTAEQPAPTDTPKRRRKSQSRLLAQLSDAPPPASTPAPSEPEASGSDTSNEQVPNTSELAISPNEQVPNTSKLAISPADQNLADELAALNAGGHKRKGSGARGQLKAPLQTEADDTDTVEDAAEALPAANTDTKISTPGDNEHRGPVIVRSAVKLSGNLELRNISFGYSRVNPPLIDDFNLVVRPGSRVALVGSSGSGKSTIAKLVTGLYQPWSGEILFDGIGRNQINRRVLTNSLSFVDQDIFLFEGTVRENLTLWDSSVPETHIVQAARDAAIHDIIATRPSGYDGPVTEGGSNFSGGQQQRLEIARALVSNPSLLVLDEATSALDPATEQEIDNHLRRRGCTCLIVAHRLSTIRDCDEIIVMENGRIVQRGVHDRLLRMRGAYASLVGAETRQTRRHLAQLDELIDL